MRALHSILNMSEYALTEFGIYGIWMWEGSEYARVTDGSTYATNVWICLNRPWIYVNRQDSEYVSYNT